MTPQDTMKSFLNENNFVEFPVSDLTSKLIDDMTKGLAKNPDGSADSASEPMIVATRTIPHSIPKNTPIICIDAGGTNFRSCLVTVTDDGVKIEDVQKTYMPASDKELNKEEFYNAIADNIEHLKNKANRIGFCFSYAMEITKDGDGKVLVFSKEIKAPEVVGTYVGKELLDTLYKKGWNKIEKITLLNDTTASLLSGIINNGGEKNFSTYMGFILGTGMNNAYIDYDVIPKLSDDNGKEHVIVCECGLFNKATQSTFDIELDKESVKPGASPLEKMCSGVYMGPLAFKMIKKACDEKIFSENFAKNFAKIDCVLSPEIDDFLRNEKDGSTKLGALLVGGTPDDKYYIDTIIDQIIHRAAAIVASVLSAGILKSGKGTNENEPVCIVCNGSTFWKTHNLYNLVTQKLDAHLSGDKKRYYEIVKVENDITLGTTAAAFM